MKLEIKELPREFIVGNQIIIKDFGKIKLDNDEMVSFVTQSGKEHDFVAKEWGFYVTPSINKRLKKEGFKIALVINIQKQLYIMSVEENKLEVFNQYLKEEDSSIVCWLDDWYKI